MGERERVNWEGQVSEGEEGSGRGEGSGRKGMGEEGE